MNQYPQLLTCSLFGIWFICMLTYGELIWPCDGLRADYLQMQLRDYRIMCAHV